MIIDRNGSDGNAFAIMAKTKQVLKAMDKSEQEITDILNSMMSDDYEHLCTVATEVTNNVITFIN